jgi:acyl-CoA hydrolase
MTETARTMPDQLTAHQAALRGVGAGRILIGGCTAEPTAVLDAVADDPEIWQGRCLTGAFIPGVNDRDYSALGQGTTVETVFVTSGLQSETAAARVAHLPMHYSTFWDRLARRGVVDLAILTVPPPAADGTVGLGLTCDFAPAAIAAGARLIGVVNPQMPDIIGAPRLPLERFEGVVEDETPLPTLQLAPPDATSREIAAQVMAFLPQGGTLQLGLGKIQGAVLEAVQQTERYDIGFHGGMISDPVLDLIEAGGFARGITTGVALGSRAFYDRLAQHTAISFQPVSQTHGFGTLSMLPSLVSVNSVVQVDLTGQANAEYVDGRQVSGQGGMVDFVRGARASKGGKAILAMRATAKGGKVSRILAVLPAGAPVSVSRADVDVIVTEFGAADLREVDIETRAARLIAIAAPQHRDALHAEWTRGRP